jgi:hypothetical protein
MGARVALSRCDCWRTGQDRDANWLLVLTRLKMRKLQLKDQIARIEDALLSDILRSRESSR